MSARRLFGAGPTTGRDMDIIFETILPVFLLLALGYLAARLNYVSEAAQKGLPEFVFRVAIPVLLFRMIALTAMPPVPIAGILISFFGACAVVWIVMSITSIRAFSYSTADAGVQAFGASFANVLMLGIPLTLSYFGDRASPVLVIILLFDATLFWIVGSLHVALGEGSGLSRLPQVVSSVFSKLITNPILIAVAIAVTWRLIGLPVPQVVDKLSTMLAGAAGATSLFAIGMALNAYNLKGSGSIVGVMTFLKLFLQPFVAWFLAIPVMGMAPETAVIVVLLAAMPVGGNAYLFATAMRRQEGAVSGAITLSTPLAVLTLSAILLWFR
jgi:malonate transporter and related proteins